MLLKFKTCSKTFEFHLKSLFGKQINEWFCRTLSAKEEAGYKELYLTKFLNVFVLFLKTYLSKFYHVFVKHYGMFLLFFSPCPYLKKRKKLGILILLNVFFQVANCICLNLNIIYTSQKINGWLRFFCRIPIWKVRSWILGICKTSEMQKRAAAAQQMHSCVQRIYTK